MSGSVDRRYSHCLRRWPEGLPGGGQCHLSSDVDPVMYCPYGAQLGKYVSWKDQKALCADLKLIYRSPTEEAALQALEEFEVQTDPISTMVL